MSQIDRIINETVQLLKDGGLGAKYMIAPFPENPREFDSANADAVLLMQYVGSRYSNTNNGGSQTRLANFALHLDVLTTGCHSNGPAEISKIYAIVQGAFVTGCALTVLRDGLAGSEPSYRKYVIELSTSFPAVPNARPTPAPFLDNFPQTEAS